MHGRPRVKDKTEDPARTRAAEQKAALLGQLVDKVLAARKARIYDALHLELSAKLLELNPEVYTVWNFRREALEGVVAGGGDPAVTAITGELDLTQRALMRNPKSYATWHHRRWAVASGCCSLEHELALVEKLLEADERNFHGWGYRRFIAERMGMPVERELEFCQRKIEQNFSNYSAWHYRSTLLPVLHSKTPGDGETANLDEGEREAPAVSVCGAAAAAAAAAAATAVVPAEVLDEEFELVKQAFYTEPEDQSGWFYHRWLLGCAIERYKASVESGDQPAALAAILQTLDTQLTMCEELLCIEPDAKWPLLTQTRLRELRLQLEAPHEEKGEEGEPFLAPKEAYEQLAEIDSMRQGYYTDAAEGKAHVVASITGVKT